jgi:threonine dehydrogenase-like Zn-dependent dehydrogenase
MKILQVTAPGEFELMDVPIPEPGPGQVLLKVEAVTTCPQWDLHLRHNDPMFKGFEFFYPYTPGQPGHEATGTIAAIGAGVTEFAVGDRVSAWRDQGNQVPGCYAQYVVHQEASVIRVPAHLPADATAPVELAMCLGSTSLMLQGINAVRGRSVAITGLGPAGLIMAQMARAEGAASVIGFDLSPARRASAAKVVDATYDPTDVDEQFPARPAKPAIETIVDCVGAKRSVEWSMDHAANVVALFGVQREPYTFDLRHNHNLKLCGYSGHSREAAEYAVGLIETGQLDLSLLSTHHLPLERYNEGIELLERQEAVKICFWPWRDA